MRIFSHKERQPAWSRYKKMLVCLFVLSVGFDVLGLWSMCFSTYHHNTTPGVLAFGWVIMAYSCFVSFVEIWKPTWKQFLRSH